VLPCGGAVGRVMVAGALAGSVIRYIRPTCTVTEPVIVAPTVLRAYGPGVQTVS
jgi:hypothetical protein